MFVPNDVFGLVLSQDGKHDVNLLPAFFLRPVNRFLYEVIHPVLVDVVHFVDREQRAPLIVFRCLFQVLVDHLLVKFDFRNGLWLVVLFHKSCLLHVFCVE